MVSGSLVITGMSCTRKATLENVVFLVASPTPDEPGQWYERHGYFVVADGSGYDPRRLAWNGDHAVEAFDLARPPEVGGINDPRDAFKLRRQ